jgi:Uncharacterised protein family (UPF0014)/Amidohydrolase
VSTLSAGGRWIRTSSTRAPCDGTEPRIPVTCEALRSALMPTINSMSATGLVSLPGMMTGQILSGVPPVEAVKYQILVMFLISGGTGFGAVAAVLGGVYRLTDARHRLRLDRLAASQAIYQWRQYIEPCIEAFGVDRWMFESNFPPDKQSGGYTELWNAFKRVTSGASAAEKMALYSGTAARVYRLTPP